MHPSKHETSLPQVDKSARKKRKYNKQRSRKITWTKPPKFAGQATFNLNTNMTPVPSSRPRARQGTDSNVSLQSHCPADAHFTSESSRNPPDIDKRWTWLLSELSAHEWGISTSPIDCGESVDSCPFKECHFSGLSYLTPEDCEVSLEHLLSQSKEIEASLEHSFSQSKEIRMLSRYSLRRFFGTTFRCYLTALQDGLNSFYIDCGDLRTYRIASLKLELYASAVKLVDNIILHYDAHLQRHRLLSAYHMPASIWKECVYDFMEALRYRQPNSISLKSVKAYLLGAKDIIRSLQNDAPHLIKYWNSYLDGLDQYIDCLEQIREGRTDWSHPDVYLGDFGQYSHNPPDPLLCSVPSTTAFSSGKAGFLKRDGDNANDNNQQKESHLTSLFLNLSDRPAIAALALRGWTVFGQAIADTFDYYHRMYKILSFTSLPRVYRGFTDVLKKFVWKD